MAAKTQGSHIYTSTEQQASIGFMQTATKDVKVFVAFWTKFNNDWSWNNAAGLAYNLILAMFPLVILHPTWQAIYLNDILAQDIKYARR